MGLSKRNFGKSVFRNINIKILDVSLTSLDLKSLSQTVFLGLMILEFLISLNGTEKNEKLSQESSAKKTQVENIQKFIENHTNVLTDDTTKAIFATGVCVGILLEVQEELYNKTAPFWNRLNRLNLDLERIRELCPEVKSKLSMYRERKYDTVINYLNVNEISKINMSSPISKENINFIFTVGLSYGSMIKRGYLT